MSETCINPGEVQEGDLMAYVDGAAWKAGAGEAVAQHIGRCPACADQVAELAALQTVLRAKLHRRSCPTPEQLIAYQQAELQDGQRLVVGLHLARCPHCARELAALAREERTGFGDRIRAAIEVLEAALVTPPLRPAEVRSPEALRSAPRVYRAGEVEVIVSQQPARRHPHRWDLSGLVHVGGQVPETVAGAKVELYRGEGLIAITQVGPRGQFTFEELDPVPYDLSLVWGDREIRLRGMPVG